MQNNFSIQVLRVVKSFWLTSKKIPRTMRLVILFLFCFVGLTNATDSYAQSAKVTMNVRNQTVEDVLRAIEKQTEFSFFYNNAHINLKRLVTISADRNDIFKVLDEVFKNKKGFVDVNVSAILDKSQIGSGNITLEPVTPE